MSSPPRSGSFSYYWLDMSSRFLRYFGLQATGGSCSWAVAERASIHMFDRSGHEETNRLASQQLLLQKPPILSKVHLVQRTDAGQSLFRVREGDFSM